MPTLTNAHAMDEDSGAGPDMHIPLCDMAFRVSPPLHWEAAVMRATLREWLAGDRRIAASLDVTIERLPDAPA
jgi:hypothetical protein